MEHLMFQEPDIRIIIKDRNRAGTASDSDRKWER